MRNLCLLLFCLLLTACVSGTGLKEEPPGLSPQQLRIELAKVSGVRIADGEPLLARFPVGTLFAQGSALPMPGGPALLDALTNLVKKSKLNWSLKVRAASGEGEQHDAELAATRAEILKVYFNNARVNMQKISITAIAEQGASLELELVQ